MLFKDAVKRHPLIVVRCLVLILIAVSALGRLVHLFTPRRVSVLMKLLEAV